MNEIKKYVQIPIISCVGKRDFLITEIAEFLKQKYEVTVDAQMISIREIIVPEGEPYTKAEMLDEKEAPPLNVQIEEPKELSEEAMKVVKEVKEEAKQADADMEQQKMLVEEEGKAQAEDDAKAQEEMEQEQEEKGKEEVKWGEE